MKAAYELVESIAAEQKKGKKWQYDQKVRFSQLLPGDSVLIRNLGLQGKHKLADHWVSNPYVVESQMPNLPVFQLRPEDGSRPMKILHRNHLLPLGLEVCLDPIPDTKPTPSRRALQRRKKLCKDESENDITRNTR